jgi:hypothetical protein
MLDLEITQFATDEDQLILRVALFFEALRGDDGQLLKMRP